MQLRDTWIGWSILAVGVIHCLFGIVAFGVALSGMASDGLWNAVDGYPGRPVAFWFMMAGVCLVLLGIAVATLQRTGLPVPAALSGLFASMVAIAVIAMPTSGAWLLVPAAAGLLWNAIRRQSANAMANPEPLP